MLGDPSLLTLILLGCAAFTAGFVDAVVGGGGLIQLPALVMGLPHASPAQLLATNKLGSVFGTVTASVTYVRRIPPDARVTIPMTFSAFGGAMGGAFIGIHIPKSAFNPIILVLLVVVGAYTLFKPDLGSVTALRFSGRAHVWRGSIIGAAIGMYDGALGPGTGSFLVFALVSWLGYAFLEATVSAKLANVATNLGALAIFVPMGLVVWPIAAIIAPANLLGGYAGARSSVVLGSGFVRGVFVVVVSTFIVKIGGSLIGFWS